MELNAAITQARLILAQEEIKPTINYRYVGMEWPEELHWDTDLKNKGYPPSSVGHIAIVRMRARRPREVYENARNWQFESVNYDLIMAIFRQLSASNRELFLGGLLNLTTTKHIPRSHSANSYFPSWNGHTSSLPLLAEFCIRNGRLELLLNTLANIEMPNANIIVMMMTFEEIISLEFIQFTMADLDGMATKLKPVRDMAYRQTWEAKRPRSGGPVENNPNFKRGFIAEGNEIVKEIDTFLVHCEKAKYWYAKGELEETRNVEVEADKTKVVGYLVSLGFSDVLVQALNNAELLYRASATGFELKSCLGHLRTFLEYLHFEFCVTVGYRPTSANTQREWGLALAFLKDNEYLSVQEEKLVAALHTLISDQAVHSLISENEYARLLRNMTIEYGLMFLTMLDKKGVRVRAVHAEAATGNTQ